MVTSANDFWTDKWKAFVLAIYTMYMVPMLGISLVSFVALIIVRRSQKPGHLRQDTLLNASLGSLLNFLVCIPEVFLRYHISRHDVFCRGSVFLSTTGERVTSLCVTLAIARRYLHMINSRNACANFLDRDLGIFVWIVSAISSSPYLLSRGIREESGQEACLPEEETLIHFEFYGLIIQFASLTAYLIMLYLILTRKVDENSILGGITGTIRASRIVRRCLIVTFIALLPVQVWVFRRAHFEGFLRNLTRTFKIFESLTAILEPVCFVMADAAG